MTIRKIMFFSAIFALTIGVMDRDLPMTMFSILVLICADNGECI